MGMAQIIRTLINEVGRHLEGLPPHPGSVAVRQGMARWGGGPVNPVAARPDPACGFLDAALAAIAGADALKAALQAARPHLSWTTYNGYPATAIGPRFPKAHAFASLVSASGFIKADGFDLGLFLIAPHTLYRDHRHAAPELYAPLTGPHGWRFGVDAPWLQKPAHEPVWNEPMAVHATAVGAVPFLCVFAWTRDVDLVASVVPASDWAGIEAAV
jgi:Dimethlysulfonioproprionate lyase